MKKKETAIIGVIVLTLFGSSGLVAKFYKLLGRTEKTEEEVKKVKEDVEKAEEEITKGKLLDREQSIYIEQMQQNQLKFVDEFKELQKAK